MKKTVLRFLAMLIAILIPAADTLSSYADGSAEAAASESAEYRWGPEVTFDGGNLVAQTDKYFFYNDEEDGLFHAMDKKKKKDIVLTDFPAANMVIYNDSLFFTDVECPISVENDNGEALSYNYGGSLYRLNGIDDLSGDLSIAKIGESDSYYYNIQADHNGFYALKASEDESHTEYVRLNTSGEELGNLYTSEDEFIVKTVESGGYLFMEVYTGEETGYILCVDRDNGTGLECTFDGICLHIVSGYILYVDNQDSFVYAVKPGETEAKVISYFPVTSMGTWCEYAMCYSAPTEKQPNSTKFAISKVSFESPFEYSYSLSVNGWVNFVEIYLEDASAYTPFLPACTVPTDPPQGVPVPPYVPPTGGGNSTPVSRGGGKKPRVHYGPGLGTGKNWIKLHGPENPPPVSENDPPVSSVETPPPTKDERNNEDAVQAVRDFLNYVKWGNFDDAVYLTKDEQTKLSECAWEDHLRAKYIKDKIRESLYSVLSVLDTSQIPIDDLEDEIYYWFKQFLDNVSFDAELEGPGNKFGVTVYAKSNGFMLLREDIIYRSGKTSNGTWIVHQIDEHYQDFEIPIKVTWSDKTKRWTVNKSDAEWFIESLLRDTTDIISYRQKPSGGGGSGTGTGTGSGTSQTPTPEPEKKPLPNLKKIREDADKAFPGDKYRADLRAYNVLMNEHQTDPIIAAIGNNTDGGLHSLIGFMTEDNYKDIRETLRSNIEKLEDTNKAEKKKIEDAYKNNQISEKERDQQLKDLKEKNETDAEALKALEREMIKIRQDGMLEKLKAGYYNTTDWFRSFSDSAEAKRNQNIARGLKNMSPDIYSSMQKEWKLLGSRYGVSPFLY